MAKNNKNSKGIGREISKILSRNQGMKRVSNLFHKITDIENIYLADKKARRHKLNTYGVKLHDKNREENLLNLQRMLIEGTYVTSDYETFIIYEPKEREIYRLPYYPDRIVHHALMNVLEGIWVPIFIKNTFSCIKGRGIHAAAKAVKKDLKEDPEGTRYCLKMDITKFYPSIDHTILKRIIRRKIKDNKVLHLLDSIIDSAEGVPIGNYLSQFFANLYLAYFDHWIYEELEVKYYYRYADDIVILHHNKEFLHDLLDKIQTYLWDNLRLTLKKYPEGGGGVIRKYQIFPVDSRGVDFVGYVFRHGYTKLRKSIKKNFCRKVAKINKRALTVKAYKQNICSWWGWCKYCNSHHLLKKILKTDVYESIQQRSTKAGRADKSGDL